MTLIRPERRSPPCRERNRCEDRFPNGCTAVQDAPVVRREPRSTVLTKEEEARIVSFRKRRLKWGGSAALERPKP
jgi:hypothetical protein